MKPEDLEAAIDKEVEALWTAGPTEAEVTEARNEELTEKISGLQRLGGFGGVADTMDYYNYYAGTPDYLAQDIARYETATVASVKAAGGASFGKSQRAIVVTIPGKKVTSDVPRSPADTDANVKVTNPYKPEFEAQQDWRKTPPAPGRNRSCTCPFPRRRCCRMG